MYAGGGDLCRGVAQRHRLVLNAPTFSVALASLTAEHCGFQHLRTYWYDGARDARPTAEHIEIANLPGIKLRLGRLTAQGQKGVDSRIVRDLITLAQERVIATAYLLGGDEELREGVAEAQERGVRVVVMSIRSSGVSATLRMEADDLIELDRDFLHPHLAVRPEEAETPAVGVPPPPTELPDPQALGREFGAQWWETTPPTTREEVRRGHPRIPADIDAALLRRAAHAPPMLRQVADSAGVDPAELVQADERGCPLHLGQSW